MKYTFKNKKYKNKKLTQNKKYIKYNITQNKKYIKNNISLKLKKGGRFFNKEDKLLYYELFTKYKNGSLTDTEFTTLYNLIEPFHDTEEDEYNNLIVEEQNNTINKLDTKTLDRLKSIKRKNRLYIDDEFAKRYIELYDKKINNQPLTESEEFEFNQLYKAYGENDKTTDDRYVLAKKEYFAQKIKTKEMLSKINNNNAQLNTRYLELSNKKKTLSLTHLEQIEFDMLNDIFNPNNPIQPNPIQPNPIQPNPIQPNPIQPNPIQPNPTNPTILKKLKERYLELFYNKNTSLLTKEQQIEFDTLDKVFGINNTTTIDINLRNQLTRLEQRVTDMQNYINLYDKNKNASLTDLEQIEFEKLYKIFGKNNKTKDDKFVLVNKNIYYGFDKLTQQEQNKIEQIRNKSYRPQSLSLTVQTSPLSSSPLSSSSLSLSPSSSLSSSSPPPLSSSSSPLTSQVSPLSPLTPVSPLTSDPCDLSLLKKIYRTVIKLNKKIFPDSTNTYYNFENNNILLLNIYNIVTEINNNISDNDLSSLD
jgi:hypothetical protein